MYNLKTDVKLSLVTVKTIFLFSVKAFFIMEENVWLNGVRF